MRPRSTRNASTSKGILETVIGAWRDYVDENRALGRRPSSTIRRVSKSGLTLTVAESAFYIRAFFIYCVRAFYI